jgi:hypothetical protein
MSFVDAGSCVDIVTGSIVERNTCRAPWTNTLDFRAAFSLPVSRLDTEITFDLLNLINLFDSENGLVEYASFNGLGAAGGAVDPITGKWIYSLATVTQPGVQRYTRDDLRSRWQAQLGLRVRF